MALFKWDINMADPIFTYENVKNNKEIGDQWRNYVLQKFNDKPSWPLLTQILGDNNTLQIDKLTPEFFNEINKTFGAPTIYKDGSIDTTPLRPPLMQKPALDQQPQKAGNKNKPGKKPSMSDDEIDAFLKEELGGNTYASADVAKGGTKTIGYDPYDPNPGNVSLAYAMRNAPEQERRTALINKWNKENGISYVTGKDGLIYRTDPQHPNGYVDPFKNDLSKTGSTGYATGQGMLTSGSNGTYATGEGIKDANGNVLTNPRGDWEYQYALKNPQYGLGMMGKMSDAQKNYLQAVSDDMGYNYNFKGATRFV